MPTNPSDALLRLPAPNTTPPSGPLTQSNARVIQCWVSWGLMDGEADCTEGARLKGKRVAVRPKYASSSTDRNQPNPAFILHPGQLISLKDLHYDRVDGSKESEGNAKSNMSLRATSSATNEPATFSAGSRSVTLTPLPIQSPRPPVRICCVPA